jgi:hypothetical protein
MTHAISDQSANHAKNLPLTILGAWFLLALGGSLLGVFDSEPRPPIMLGLAAGLPIIVFALRYATSTAFRQFVLSLDLRTLTLAQTWRVAGIAFLVLHYQQALPGVFAIPAGWGDTAVGITAPFVAWYWMSPFPNKAFVAWNLLGILDLVVAVGLGVLSSASPLGILADGATTRLMGQFPMSLIPTFFVPLFLILHLICLARVRNGIQ